MPLVQGFPILSPMAGGIRTLNCNYHSCIRWLKENLPFKSKRVKASYVQPEVAAAQLPSKNWSNPGPCDVESKETMTNPCSNKGPYLTSQISEN